MAKKFLWFIIMLLFFGLSTVSCADEYSSEAQLTEGNNDIQSDDVSGGDAIKQEKKTIQVWVYDSFAKGIDAPIYQAAEDFMSSNPDIEIEIIPTQYGSSPYRDKFITAAQAGVGPDVLMMDIIWTPQVAAAQLVMPLEEYVGNGVNDFYVGPLDTCKYDDQLYGLPFYTNALAMFYNKTAFEENGVPLPHSSWTWDDFTRAAKSLTKDDMYGFGLMAGWGGTFEWFPWVWQNDASILDEQKTKAAFGSPEGIESIEVFLGLIVKDGVVPEAAKSWKSWDELAVAFSSEVIAMYEVGDWGISAVDEMQPDFEWDVAPLPMNKTSASVVGGANWVINKNTKYPDESYKWLAYITGTDVFSLMDKYNRLAARKGGDQNIVKEDPRMQVYLDSLEYARSRPSIPNWTVVDYDCLQPAFLKVILEGENIEEMIMEAEQCTNDVLSE